ncbi:unnamed protein product [Cercospora beticola]|nr:unnamed protein product [Cercospora beticola]
MCNGAGRASQGGRIVILQPVFQNFTTNTATSSRPTLTRGFSLRLDDDGDRSCTTVTIDGSKFSSPSSSRSSSPSSFGEESSDEDVEAESERFSWRGSSFVIHRDGDLSSSHSGCLDDTSSILHRFDVPALAQDRIPFSLSKRFDLGVGGEGIVGRRVTLIRDHLVVGQGIVGWN